MRERALAFTCTGQREKYLRLTLESWRKVRGIEDWSLVFSFEPCETFFPIEAFYDWADRTFPDVTILVNKTRQGCTRNTFQAMDTCFRDGARFTVLAEEDIQVSTDVLEYFTFAQKYEGEVAAACAHVKSSHGGRVDQVTRAAWFSPLVWGTWAGTWRDFVAPGWGGKMTNREAWDTNLRDSIREAGQWSLFPVQSRSQHFGEISTLTTTEIATFLYESSRSECFEPDREPVTWTEVAFDSVPSLLV